MSRHSFLCCFRPHQEPRRFLQTCTTDHGKARHFLLCLTDTHTTFLLRPKPIAVAQLHRPFFWNIWHLLPNDPSCAASLTDRAAFHFSKTFLALFLRHMSKLACVFAVVTRFVSAHVIYQPLCHGHENPPGNQFLSLTKESCNFKQGKRHSHSSSALTAEASMLPRRSPLPLKNICLQLSADRLPYLPESNMSNCPPLRRFFLYISAGHQLETPHILSTRPSAPAFRF